MSIESVKARMSQVAAEYKNLMDKPESMFRALLQEKLGAWEVEMQRMDSEVSASSSYQYLSAASDAAAALDGAGAIYDSVQTTWKGAEPYMDIVASVSKKYNMPVNLILGVMKAESDFNNHCVSSAGAKGLMQLMPETAQEVGVTDVFDPAQNIEGGVQYITKLINKYNGDVRLALAAYNTGPAKIARRNITSSLDPEYQNVPSIVREYANRVLRYAGYQV